MASNENKDNTVDAEDDVSVNNNKSGTPAAAGAFGAAEAANEGTRAAHVGVYALQLQSEKDRNQLYDKSRPPALPIWGKLTSLGELFIIMIVSGVCAIILWNFDVMLATSPIYNNDNNVFFDKERET